MSFPLFISLFILQRLSEIFIARKNEYWLRKNGAIEYGRRHYSFIIILHSVFIASLIIEYIERTEAHFDYVFFIIFVFLIFIKIWTITSLGKYWNTKIFRIPGSQPQRKGPYKFLKHPNYVIVVLEFIFVPLVFQLYYSAVIFSLLNAIMLSIRIKEEDRIWSDQ